MIPIPVLICVVVAAIAFYVLRFSYIGRQIYAVGGNIEAARFSGINVDARVILCYIVSVLCAVLVGMIQAARMSQGHPGSGDGYELQAITACIVGGVSFMGGEGGVLGIIIGAMLMGTLQNAMIMLNVSPYWHQVVISMVLLVAITVDYTRRRRRAYSCRTPGSGSAANRGLRWRTAPRRPLSWAQHVATFPHQQPRIQRLSQGGDMMTSQKPVGIGFMGAGEISLLHAKAVKAIPGATLVGLWNRT